MNTRGSLDAEDLLKLILLLVVVWLVISVLDGVLGLFQDILSFFPDLIGLVIVVLVILWLLDRI
ncbi:DUF7554 family protein [Halolamina sediminis]|jgi:flagellar biosynthesis protein FliQ|uniref:DUF7554 family protein n=1 Tax=Halolamina sediminis TaxID=1480675 RepID=UPI0006B43525|nr:hypothetical protein [Halolamina sediminis]